MEKLCECGCGNPAPIAPRTDATHGWIKGQPKKFVCGHNIKAVRHGMNGTPEYSAYKAAKNRCANPANKKWKNYAGRGIKFLFTSFEQWFAELGPRPTPDHSVDRIENDSHYMVGNVRWATRVEQARNQRRGPLGPRLISGRFAPRNESSLKQANSETGEPQWQRLAT